VEDPQPGAGEVLVRIEACGLCGSDLNAWRGVPGIEYPLPTGAPGHEPVGQIVALGPGVDSLDVGDRVTGPMSNGFAELGTARAEYLVRVPLALERAGPVLGEPLACAMNVVRRARVAPGDRLIVVGFGYLAALIVQLLEHDHEWMAIARRPESRQLALSLGARAAYDFGDVPSDLWDCFPVVVEAAGVQQTLDFATWLTAYGGRLVIAGYHADGPRTVNMQSWNWKGIDVINAHERQLAVYASGLRHAFDIAHGRELRSFVTHEWSLERAADAFHMAESRPPGFIKGVLRP
jgi:threonine dehydrogenase-like Zn-dependent dehydrogenase